MKSSIFCKQFLFVVNVMSVSLSHMFASYSIILCGYFGVVTQHIPCSKSSIGAATTAAASILTLFIFFLLVHLISQNQHKSFQLKIVQFINFVQKNRVSYRECKVSVCIEQTKEHRAKTRKIVGKREKEKRTRISETSPYKYTQQYSNISAHAQAFTKSHTRTLLQTL